MKSLVINTLWVAILILTPPCCGLRSKRSPIATTTFVTTTTGTTQLSYNQTSPLSTLTTDTSRFPTTDMSHFTTRKNLFPENSQMIDALNQELGKIFLKHFVSPSVRCAIDHVLIGYKSVFENWCNIEELQKIRKEIEDWCPDEALVCSLTLHRAKTTGIRICIDSTLKIDQCLEIDISNQELCDDFYVLTLNCSLMQNNSESTTTTSVSIKGDINENDDGVSVVEYIGVALGCFCFGILMTLLVVLILYKRRQQMRKRDQASIDSRDFPNLRRPLPIPRNKSEIYDQIEESGEIQQAKLISILSEDNYNHLNEGKSVKESTPIRYTSSLKRENTPTFDPQKSIGGSATQKITKYGNLSPRDAIDSQGTDSMGYLSSRRLSEIRAMKGTTTDSNDNITGIVKIDEEKGLIGSEEEKVKTNGDPTDDMEGPDYRDSEEMRNKEMQNDNADGMQEEIIMEKKKASEDMEEPTYRQSDDCCQDEMTNEVQEENKMSNNESTCRHSNEGVTEEVENGKVEKRQTPDTETEDYYILEVTERRA